MILLFVLSLFFFFFSFFVFCAPNFYGSIEAVTSTSKCPPPPIRMLSESTSQRISDEHSKRFTSSVFRTRRRTTVRPPSSSATRGARRCLPPPLGFGRPSSAPLSPSPLSPPPPPLSRFLTRIEEWRGPIDSPGARWMASLLLVCPIGFIPATEPSSLLRPMSLCGLRWTKGRSGWLCFRSWETRGSLLLAGGPGSGCGPSPCGGVRCGRGSSLLPRRSGASSCSTSSLSSMVH